MGRVTSEVEPHASCQVDDTLYVVTPKTLMALDADTASWDPGIETAHKLFGVTPISEATRG